MNSQLITIDAGSTDTRRRPRRSMQRGRLSRAYSAAVTVTLTRATTRAAPAWPDRLHDRQLDPTQSNGTVYAGAFTVSRDDDGQVPAFDIAGNAEAVNSQLITIDTGSRTRRRRLDDRVQRGRLRRWLLQRRGHCYAERERQHRAAPASPRSSTRPTARLRRRRTAPSTRALHGLGADDGQVPRLRRRR